LNPKYVFVSGASRGIGQSILKLFSSKGFPVIGTSTSDEGVKTIDGILSKSSADGFGIKLDLSEKKSIENLFDTLKEKDVNPEIVINNAGVTRDNIFLRMKDEEWNEVIQVHLSSVFSLLKFFSKKMVKNRSGRIINISSTSAAIGNKGQANYAAAKSGLEAFSRSLARELAPRNITVNCVAPGFIETDMIKSMDEDTLKLMSDQIPLGRLGSSQEVAELIYFLSSEEANYITGQTIHINGGLYM
tara:strand:+ start:295 stop:1029 length:735 start_codon:yes stop_codon:yes gene_type:complete